MARGRDATKPMEIGTKGWKDILLRVKTQISDDNLMLIAAGVAFYGLLAIFPGISALMAVAGLLFDEQTVVAQLSELGSALPEEAAAIIIGQAQDVAGAEETGLRLTALVSIAIALWSASAGVSALMEGINVAYDEEELRGFVRRTLIRIALTLMLIAGFIVIVALAVVVPIVLGFVPDIGGAVTWLIGIARWAVIFLVVVGMLAAFYRWGPNRADAQWRWTTPGALVATVFWVLGSVAFSIYVRNFAGYQETFGALAGVVILLMWLWVSALIILIGAEFDAEMEAQTRRDTTTGEPQPMGERGAVKADNLGEAQS